MNVLLIAPDNGLPDVQNEVRSVSMVLRSVPLTGTVNRRDVLDALERQQWNVIWFAAHGDEKGIQLSDGMLNVSDMTAIVRNSGASLVVLNSCSSRFIGLEMHYELGIDVITTVADAADITAYQTGTLLARNLASGMEVTQAFERSRPGQNNLYYLFTDKTKHEYSDEESAAMIELIRTEFSKIYKIMDEMKRDINARIEGLNRTVDERITALSNQYESADKRIYAMEYATQRTSPMDRWFAITLSVFMFIMLIVYFWQGLIHE